MSNDLTNLHIDKSKFLVRRGKTKGKIYLSVAAGIIIVLGILYGTGILQPAIRVHVSGISTIFPSQTFTLLNASGYVVAQRKSAISSKITSSLVSLSVEEGSRAKKGDVIACLENKDAIAALKRAKADMNTARYRLKQAEAELTEAKLAYNRTTNLLQMGVVSPSEYDTADAKYKLAIAKVEEGKAAIRSGKAAVSEAKVQLDYTFLRAPFDGVVLTKNADIGDIVTPVGAAANARASVVTIADLDSLMVEVDVSESNIEQVSAGHPCEIQLDAFPGERLRGEVHMIVPTADRTKASILVKVAFADKDSRIMPEMSAKVAFLKRHATDDERKPIKAIPVTAVRTMMGKNVVYTVENNRLVEKVISTGRCYDAMIEILSGLEDGWKIVTDGNKKMKNGRRVKISEE
ncbi:acriflavin resistance protein [Candidatus Kuenenia stuttgartiensis]|jgi:RND family efflux transporter MFP subunit|uniref:Acriflavin resistance protein n=1 Tax=Kuenenia stuttgartiensis TaxID=174633 RepID=Q1Q198_KUEST|nr:MULTISPECIES: efflux RND transporter periplasmic adaptor subunit [Kuenenia]MBE7547687.1 efflux RND transporter periplasmic adaptor subunit [Planctomycetia bacterium]MBW7943367.1 efflux RND transporter periplasmic adaptor subunit [Candidatus Kuenenia stuttgartiensis]MBZ0192158.1 efflux RND transporter periplasmic adaptor subunit [Candidatus Kuenenia stuttgartiensis]MCL4728709.1 efflux RND transporter periplasmic adaptor subunit [Candidatus Kuenenia stuttgartiensis]MCZ7623666.1 efflux RND tra